MDYRVFGSAAATGSPRGVAQALWAGISSVALLAAAAPAFAQVQGEANASDDSSEIVVTGSRIRHTEANAAAPISIVTAEELQASGTVNVAYFLNRMPEFGSQSNQEQGFASSSGISSVELRNLGTVRTLVLVNGQRMTPSGGQIVDFNSIPTALIERVDVLKDGASPIYGSDAVGGVVNVILRGAFDGLVISGGVGVSSRGDRETYELSSLFGATTDRSSLMVGLSYNEQDVVLSADRDFAHLSAAQGGQTIRATPTVGRFYVPSGPSAGYYLGTPSGGYQAVSASDPAATLNVGELIYIVDPQQRFNITALGEYELTPDLSVYAQGMFTRSSTSHQAALFPIGDAYVSNMWPTGLHVPATLHDGMPNPYNPFGVNMGLRVAPGQLGQRVFNNIYDTAHIRAGARGRLWEDFQWSVGYAFGVSDNTRSEDNATNFTHAAQLLGLIPCSAQEVAQGCVLTNFGGDNLSQAQIDYVRFTPVDHARYTQDYWHASIDGPLFALPAGDLQIALGVETRRESYQFEPDGLKVAGEYYGGSTYPTSGHYRVTEGFAEINAPILADAPLAHSLTLDAAFRLSSYSLSRVGDVATWKAGFVYSPIEDITLRAHYGTGIRAPTVLELFDGGSSRILGYVDPCDLTKNIAGATAIANCANLLGALGVDPVAFRQELGGMTTTTAGNPNLDAEISENLTVGVVIRPRILPNLSIMVDYYEIEVTDAISSTASFAQVLINECYASVNLSSDACDLFSPRQAASGGAFGSMTARNINLGFIRTHGFDLGLDYLLGMDGFGLDGDLHFEAHASYQPSFEVQQPTGTVSQFAGAWRTTTDSTAYPEWRATAAVAYRADDWSVTWETQFIQGTTRQGGNPSVRGVVMPDIYYHHLMADYRIGDVMLSGGVRNVFDENPPYAAGDLYTNTITNVYDFIGRYGYLRASIEF